MKWCRFQVGSHVSYGIVEDARVVEVRGNPLAEHTMTRTSHPLAQVHLIHEMSKTATLHPGDVLWMGTEGADGDMVPGDVIEVEISDIGTLRNYVVAET